MDRRSAEWDFTDVPSGVKTLRLLAVVATTGDCSLTDLMAITQLPKSTLLRLLGTLVDEGFLDRPAHGRYRPALKLWQLGCGAVDYERVHSQVLPVLRRVVVETAETAHYAVYDAGRAVYVEKVDGSHPIRAYTSVGSSSPAYATATGKALLSWQGDAEIERVLEAAERFTDTTIADPEGFRAVAGDVRQRGFATNRGEWREGVWGIAAPVFDRQHEVIAAIGVSGPHDRIAESEERYSALVMAAAEELSSQLGYRRPAGARS